MTQNHLHLATFGDGKIDYILAAERLENEARLSGWFSSVSNWIQYGAIYTQNLLKIILGEMVTGCGSQN